MRQILSPLRRGGIKAGILIIAILLSVIAVAQSSKKAAKASALEVSFNYQRQAGPGSNQYAVWIENEKGEFVKTLFVTSYTTKGRARGGEQPKRGYIVRPACVPTWVKTSKAEEKTDVQLDAVTGATPQSGGVQTFTWDFTDEQGKAVPQGTYKVKGDARWADITLVQAAVVALRTGMTWLGSISSSIQVRSTLISCVDVVQTDM